MNRGGLTDRRYSGRHLPAALARLDREEAPDF